MDITLTLTKEEYDYILCFLKRHVDSVKLMTDLLSCLPEPDKSAVFAKYSRCNSVYEKFKSFDKNEVGE